MTARALLLGLLLSGCQQREALPPALAPTPPPRLKTGKVYISGVSYASGSDRFSAAITGAHFFATRPATTTATIGPCDLRVKSRPPAGSAPLVEASAGTITITGGKRPFTLAAEGGAGPIYPRQQLEVLAWAGGEQLTVEASGAEVPHFSAIVRAPGYLKLSDPVVKAGAKKRIARDQDLTFKWAPSDGADVVLVFGGATTDGWRELDCRFKGTAGQGLVPAAALAELPAGTGVHHGFATQTPEVKAGDWTVALQISSALLSSDGDQLYQVVEYR